MHFLLGILWVLLHCIIYIWSLIILSIFWRVRWLNFCLFHYLLILSKIWITLFIFNDFSLFVCYLTIGNTKCFLWTLFIYAFSKYSTWLILSKLCWLFNILIRYSMLLREVLTIITLYSNSMVSFSFNSLIISQILCFNSCVWHFLIIFNIILYIILIPILILPITFSNFLILYHNIIPISISTSNIWLIFSIWSNLRVPIIWT